MAAFPLSFSQTSQLTDGGGIGAFPVSASLFATFAAGGKADFDRNHRSSSLFKDVLRIEVVDGKAAWLQSRFPHVVLGPMVYGRTLMPP